MENRSRFYYDRTEIMENLEYAGHTSVDAIVA